AGTTIMPALKRPLDDNAIARKSKKSRTERESGSDAVPQTKPAPSQLVAEEVDFPRGGGTSFTPLEVKAIRAEAVKEANAELFKESEPSTSKKRKRKSEAEPAASTSKEKSDKIRIEHLNYKRLNAGQKILGQIVSIEPLALIISLPNQLFGHVPITNVSSQLTALLQTRMDQDEEDEEQDADSDTPELSDLFRTGQYVRAVVTAVHASGSTDTTGVGRSRDDMTRASRRVELSLVPEAVNMGIQKSDIKPGFTISAAVQSVEDHGYILDLGVPKMSGFLSFKDAKDGPFNSEARLAVGRLLDVTVASVSKNGRTCQVSADTASFVKSCLTEATNATSLVPGALVQSLITNVHTTGLNLQILGFFDGTIDESNLSDKTYKIGKKVKARILYDFSSSPPKFALSLADHVVALGVKKADGEKTIQEAYPIGTIIEEVKVAALESERGIVVSTPDVRGFVHISHVSDDHVPSISSSGSWKVGSIHRARVTGYFPFDGLLQLSLKPSILEQRFLRVSDVQVGEVIKGTIKRLTDSGLFVLLSGNVDGVVWPNHFADIALKHPAKRFKPGASIKCRVLVVDPERKRIALTAKKTLVESTLPLITSLSDAKIGTVTHAVVFKIFEKHLLVEFFNNLKAMVPLSEVSETPIAKLAESFPLGRVVKVRITHVDDSSRITASIRQASSNFDVVDDISAVEIGNIVQGVVSEIHAENAVLSLQPSKVRALISLNNVANYRKLSVAQLRATLKPGDRLEDLVVVTRNPEKSFVIVASKPKSKDKVASSSKGPVSLDTVAIGDIVGGRVTRHVRNGALVKLGAHLGGILHPTDVADDYTSAALPAVDAVLKAAVIAIDHDKKQLTLSMRASRMHPETSKPIVDNEIRELSDLHVGQTIRGFVKSITDAGVFVTLGPEIDARVQIKEMFDDFVKEWKPRFSVNQLVQGRILSTDLETRKVELTLRSENAPRSSNSSLSISELKVGDKVDGTVSRIEDYGLFIQIDGSKLKGLCHKSQLSDTASADVAAALQGFRQGDKLKAVIIGIEKSKISFSIKPSLFDDADFQLEDEDVDDEDEDEDANDDEAQEAPNDSAEEAVEENGDDSEDEDIDAMDVDVSPHYQVPATSKPQTAPTLQLAGGFQWSSGGLPEEASDASESESEASDAEEQGGKRKKRRKRKEIELDMTGDMHTKTPESTADFERLLLGSPNSSYLWIQYMSFQLQLSEVDKARDIARRALNAINFREEQEKLNVWIALLNLENAYGTDESLDAVFKEAARANDSKTVHLRLAQIYAQSDKPTRNSINRIFLRQGRLEESRQLLPRALKGLEKRKHLKTISRFAQLEYKLGDPERGKTLFEGIIESHPKRLDIWSVYMDMEAGQQQIQSLRSLFDRVLTVKMTSHKAKAFFKKWLELEKRIGDESGVELVKSKAVEWTQRAS
ncbi:unnamed protein product, partial [Mycena citricolor]